MDHALLVGRVERETDLLDDGHDLLDRQRTAL